MAEVGSKIGKYEIIREIARSNDVVFEAYDPSADRRVAVKQLLVPDGASHGQVEDRKKRFLREARAAGALSHPNIVTVYEVGEEDGACFIAMEYLEGRTLGQEIEASGFIEVRRALKIAQEVCSALAYAHGKGTVHRDVKPDNIQVLPDGRVKLTDFGIARLMYEPNLTVDGQVFGTPSYMSPEQIAGRQIDARTDIFSLGVVLFEMLTGQKPFAGDSVIAISLAITTKPVRIPPSVPPLVAVVLDRALQKRPESRQQSAEDFADELAGLLLGPDLGAIPTSGSARPVAQTVVMNLPGSAKKSSAGLRRDQRVKVLVGSALGLLVICAIVAMRMNETPNASLIEGAAVGDAVGFAGGVPRKAETPKTVAPAQRTYEYIPKFEPTKPTNPIEAKSQNTEILLGQRANSNTGNGEGATQGGPNVSGSQGSGSLGNPSEEEKGPKGSDGNTASQEKPGNTDGVKKSIAPQEQVQHNLNPGSIGGLSGPPSSDGTGATGN